MVKKSFNVLKNNPILVLYYAVYLIISFLIMFLIYPNNLSQFTNTDNMADFNFAAYISAMSRILLASLIVYIIGLVFISGFGNMIKEAVLQEKVPGAAFLSGIKKFFVRNLLATLLLLAFSIGYSIIVSILVIIITLTTQLIYAMAIFIPILSIFLVMIAIPFVILWFPAIFIDDIGVIRGLTKGAKAGAKNYWRLLLLMLVMYVPIVGNMIFNYESMTSGVIFSLGTNISYILTAAITIFALPYIFIVYNEYYNSSN